MLETSLYQGERVSLTAIQPESDTTAEARWMQDPDYYLTARRAQPFRPMSAGQLKIAFEEEEKSTGRHGNRFHFAIRRNEDQALVGFLHLLATSWANRAGVLAYSFASPNEETEYGDDLLRLAMRFTFDELNLHRITSYVPEHLQHRISQLTAAGFQCEARRRKVVYRAGRLWDELVFGMLEGEWAGHSTGGGAE